MPTTRARSGFRSLFPILGKVGMGAAALAGMALFVVACGGGESPTATPTQVPPTPTATAAPTEPPTDAPAMTSGLAWEEVMPAGPKSAPMPAPRKDSTLIHDSANNTLLLFGGREKGQALNDLWSFDLETRMWTEIEAEGPSPRFGHLSVFDVKRSRMVVFSGQAGTDFFNDTWSYDPASGQWEELQPEGDLPVVRYGGCSGYDPENDLFYISHGFTNSGRFDDTWSFNLATDSWTDLSPSGDRPVKRCLHQCFFDATSNQLVLFGGQSNAVPILGDLWKFDVATGAWTETEPVDPAPLPRFNYSMAGDPESGEFFLFGGLTSQGKGDDLWAYSAAEGWSNLGTGHAPGLLSNQASVYLKDENALYLFGGLAAAESNTLWRVQPN